MKHAFETILIEFMPPHILLVTLNRPKVSNALNTKMAHELIILFEEFSLNLDCVRAIVLTGSGTRAFCAGGDLKERQDMSDTDWTLQHLVYKRVVRAVLACPIPTIGAINSAAYGGGCELVSAFDFCFATETAKFAQLEVKIGIIPGAGGTQTLARAIGERRAKELILTGKPFTAVQALKWGLLNDIFPADEILSAAVGVAKQIALNAPIASRQAKQAIHKGLQMGLADGLAFEIEAYNRTIPTGDRREGMAAFNQKRTPKLRDVKLCQ